jgi:allantoinase
LLPSIESIMTRRAFVSNRGVVLADGIRPAALLVREGLIEAICAPDEVPSDVEIVDVGEATIMAGIIDPHVHINEPGRTHWEGFETATRAAAKGGLTTLVDMPLNSSPVTTNVAALEAKLEAARGKLSVDCGFYGGLVPGNATEMASLIEAGAIGIKAFLCHSGIDDFPNATEADLREALPVLARYNVPLLVHAELVGPVDADREAQASGSSRSHHRWMESRPADFELDAIRLLIDLCREYRAPIHIVHLATAEALPMLADARAEGLPLTVETAPHYLFFCDEEIPDGATQYKCAPPIRDRENREGLWQGLRDGIIDMVATDHSPAPPELKGVTTGDFDAAWGGISSLQVSLPVVWTEARRRGFGLEHVTKWMSAEPARFLRLEGTTGALVPGKEANFVVFDDQASFVVEAARLEHLHKITPYDGLRLDGQVKATYLRGERVDDRGGQTGAIRLRSGSPQVDGALP